MLESYRVKGQCATVHNSRANIVERMHLTIGNHCCLHAFVSKNWEEQMDNLFACSA